MIISKIQLKYIKLQIYIHSFFISLYRNKVNSLTSNGKIILSRRLKFADKLLNHHCNQIINLKHKLEEFQ